MGNIATPILPTHVDANFQAASRIAWAFVPHEQAVPNMTVRVDAGSVFDGAMLTEVAAQSTAALVAPVGNPRIDRLVLDRDTGLVVVVTGIAAASPVAPAIPAGHAPLAQVLLDPTDTVIVNAMITDERNLNGLGLGSAAYKAASDDSLPVVASVSGAITAGHVAVFSDTAGTVEDGGALPIGLALPGFIGLKIVNDATTPDTKIAVSADAIVTVTATGVPAYAASVALTIDLTTTGANGMDTGSRPTSGWVYVFAISNGSTTAGLASLSATAPTLPGGYTRKARLGAMYCDASQNLKRTIQLGRRAQYRVTAGTNTPSMPLMAIGVMAGISPLSVAGFVPPTANTIRVVRQASSTVNSGQLVCPNGDYGNLYTMNPAPLQVTTNEQGSELGELVLESGDIYYAQQVNNQIFCLGWEDNL